MSEKKPTNRRDFLKGRSALDALRDQVESEKAESEQCQPSRREGLVDRQAGYLEQYLKNAMACEFELLFNLHQFPQAGAAAMNAFQLIDELEDQLTIYREHSEVSRLNREAQLGSVIVEPNLFELLELAGELHAQTGGAFDITSTPLTRAWGFDQRQGEVPSPAEVETALEKVGADSIELDPATQSVRFLKPGLSINLGGIGKGYALDQVAGLVESRGIFDFVIHGGQSSVIARGSSLTGRGDSAKNTSLPESSATTFKGWPVGISHPTLPGVRIAEVNLKNQALGTSGTGRQGFFHRGKRFGHILDPRTGWPPDHFLSTTVISPSAAVSDALATAFFVMSTADVAAYCDRHQEIAVILISKGGPKQEQVKLETLNLSAESISYRT